MIKDMKQYGEYDRKNNNSGVLRNKSNENETNIHKKPKGIIQTPYHISKTRKENSDKDEGSKDEREAYQMKEKGTNRHSERKYDYHSQNESHITKRLRNRSKNKEINKSRDKLLTAQNLSDLEQKTNKKQNVMRHICAIGDKYIKTGIQCGNYQRWFHFKCENTTEEQVSKDYLATIQQYICMQDQHKKFESTFQFQFQKKTEEIKK